MRILYFTERDTPHDQRFLNALSGTAHQVFALRQYACSPDTPENMAECSWPLAQPDWSDWQGWEDGLDQFQSILADVQPDIVHAGPVQGPAFLAALAEFEPLLTMSWGSDLLVKAKRSPWMRCATRYTLSNTRFLFADCQTVANQAVGYDFPEENIFRFPWGVDLKHFSPENGKESGRALRHSLGWADKFILMCNRTWSPLYGVDVLASAFAAAAQENENLRLLLIGDGPQSHFIREILAAVEDKVSFLGRVSQRDLPGAYCAADLYVSPSHSDGSSISLLEALACGRPVLVSDIPSNQEWVQPGLTGELFEDGRIKDLKKKILQMADDSRLPQYGSEARRLAKKRADWKKNFQVLLKAYQQTLE